MIHEYNLYVYYALGFLISISHLKVSDEEYSKVSEGEVPAAWLRLLVDGNFTFTNKS